MIVVDVPNTTVREIVYTYLGSKKSNGDVMYDVGVTLHPELDKFEELPDGTHKIRWAKDGMVMTVRPAWLYWTEVVRPAKKTVMGKPDAQKPTVVN